MDEKQHTNVASMLLNSADSKVAAAARRVFSNVIAAETNPQEQVACPNPPIVVQNNHERNNATNGLQPDIKEAASAMAMLAPKNAVTEAKDTSKDLLSIIGNTKTLQPSTVSASTDFSVDLVKIPANPQSSIAADNAVSNIMLPLDRKKVTSPSERLQRSRERNKMHARKTRQRKKEQMKTLEKQVEVLKASQIDLKRKIEEKNTVNILLELCAKCEDGSSTIDPKVEALLKRANDDIPDSSKVPELPALILPGQHSNRRGKTNVVTEYPDDGIDYKLLAKDRATCSQEELDRIRRERNRMHAKRTRDRKRIFVEEMESIIKQLESENSLLENHLKSFSDSSSSSTPTLGRSPSISACTPSETVVPTIELLGKACQNDIAKFFPGSKRPLTSSSAAICSDTSTTTVSTHNSDGNTSENSQDLSHTEHRASKKRCLEQ